MVLRNVAKTFSLEEQRQEINEIAVDLDAVNTTLANWNAGDWDTAYSWGDHAQAGYWVDNATSRSNWDTAYGWGDHGTVGYWVEDSVKITNWDTAYGWGDHGAAGYLVATAASYNNTNWDTSYSWGDHALAGYLTSYTETDPVFGASAASGIAAGDITNWNTAYGWGDHGTAGYAASGDIPTPGGTYSGAGTPEDPSIESIQLNAGSGNFGGDTLLVWNTTDNRLGVNNSSPTVTLDVTGTIKGTAVLGTSLGIAGQVNLQTATSDELDHYEEGTWTSTIGGPIGLSAYNFIEGYYTRIGELVYIEAEITYTSSSTNTELGFTFNPPFAMNTNGDKGSVFCGSSYWSASRGIGGVADNTSSNSNEMYVILHKSQNDISGSGICRFSVTYHAL